jgi:nitrate reductase (NAD(P)H)
LTCCEHFTDTAYRVSEDDIKNQNWRGKEEKADKDTAKQVSNAPGDKDKSSMQENGQDPSELSQAEHAFYTRFIQELDEFKALQNNPAIPPHKRAGVDGSDVFKIAFTRRRIGDPVEEGRQVEVRSRSQEAMEIQIDDQFTPDNWIPRSNHLLRLTGKHPLNAETDFAELYDAGLITPTKLHYVRSHGSVPRLSWESHTLSISSDPPGMLEPAELSMDQIVNDYPSIEIPVTIACDGIRRGEVNMVKRSAAFSWSAGGVSTCLWTGVPVRDLLLARNMVEQPANERWYLNVEGADEPSEGKYSTSIPFAHAVDPNNDVMLAYGINGAPLSPDHGYPLRIIIPTYVGGRQVKWVNKMWISKMENTSHYHIYDNRASESRAGAILC